MHIWIKIESYKLQAYAFFAILRRGTFYDFLSFCVIDRPSQAGKAGVVMWGRGVCSLGEIFFSSEGFCIES